MKANAMMTNNLTNLTNTRQTLVMKTKNTIKGFNILPHYAARNIVADLLVLDGKYNWKSICIVAGERENILAIAREWAKKTGRD